MEKFNEGYYYQKNLDTNVILELLSNRPIGTRFSA